MTAVCEPGASASAGFIKCWVHQVLGLFSARLGALELRLQA